MTKRLEVGQFVQSLLYGLLGVITDIDQFEGLPATTRSLPKNLVAIEITGWV